MAMSDKTLAERYEDAVYRGDLEEMVKLREEAVDEGVKEVDRKVSEVLKLNTPKEIMKMEKSLYQSKEDKIIKLLEEILERMPPKFEGHGVCGKKVSGAGGVNWLKCIRMPGHPGKCEAFE